MLLSYLYHSLLLFFAASFNSTSSFFIDFRDALNNIKAKAPITKSVFPNTVFGNIIYTLL